jgi:hypothetical protein
MALKIRLISNFMRFGKSVRMGGEAGGEHQRPGQAAGGTSGTQLPEAGQRLGRRRSLRR